jgi:hypothetical protein
MEYYDEWGFSLPRGGVSRGSGVGASVGSGSASEGVYRLKARKGAQHSLPSSTASFHPTRART